MIMPATMTAIVVTGVVTTALTVASIATLRLSCTRCKLKAENRCHTRINLVVSRAEKNYVMQPCLFTMTMNVASTLNL